MHDKLKKPTKCATSLRRGGARIDEGPEQRRAAAADGNLTLDCIEQALDIWARHAYYL